MLRTSREVPDLNDLADLQVQTGLKVLIVDDNEDQAAMLATLVRRWGHSVMIANTAAEALQVNDAWCPRVVLLDLGLPDIHGYDLAEGIRARCGDRKIYFVAVTGWTSIADQLRCTSAGIRHHIMKPVNPDVIREILNAYVSLTE